MPAPRTTSIALHAWARTLCLTAFCSLGLTAAPARSADLATSEPVSALTAPAAGDVRKVELGERLFRSKLLSKDGTVACDSCHALDRGGDDDRRVSVGIGGATGATNAPTVFNAALNFRQFWDGRADTLEAQIDGPMQNPVEMGTGWSEALAALAASAEFSRAFQEVYGGAPTAARVKDAIAAFERTLITTDSRLDRYLKGDRAAMSADEVAGFTLFKQLGCVSCHQGANIGGNMFQVFGVMGDYFKDRGGIKPADSGRFNVTKREIDRHVFKVPSLRNVAVTAPYFHDGSAATLADAVRIMGRYQIGRELSDEEVGLLVKFLHTLTGTYKGRSL